MHSRGKSWKVVESLRDGETTINIKIAFFEGEGIGGRLEEDKRATNVQNGVVFFSFYSLKKKP